MSIPIDQGRCRKSLIFVVDRQPEICEFVRKTLESAGCRVQTFSRRDAYSEIQLETPALIIVGIDAIDAGNIILPEGLFLAPTVMKIPCIALLGSSSEEQRRMALDAGADDCIVKPFSAQELVLVVQRCMQRTSVIGAATMQRADMIIDGWAMKVSVRGIEISTTALEFRLLEYLAHHRGQVFTRDFLLDAVWGDMRFINPRSVDACVRRVREKIEPDRTRPTMLKTIRGVGYRLDANTEWQSAPSAGCRCSACRSRESGLRWQSGGRQGRDSAGT
jgi:two-component system phosphate regulon response regulator PhoB